jgi:uncharacterized membrane protein
VTLVLTGVMAGVFFTFSNSVMPGLDAIAAVSAVRAMQSINRKIQNPVFLLTVVGTPFVAAVTGVLLLFLEETSAATLFFLAAAAYGLGALALTAIVNVPMNNSLDTADVPNNEQDASQLWLAYSPRWTRWNTLRAVCNTLSLVLVGLGLFVWK